jgi:hypothetical protein
MAQTYGMGADPCSLRQPSAAYGGTEATARDFLDGNKLLADCNDLRRVMGLVSATGTYWA